MHLLVAIECHDVFELVLAEDFRMSVFLMDVCHRTRAMAIPIMVRNNPLWSLMGEKRRKGILATTLRVQPKWLRNFDRLLLQRDFRFYFFVRYMDQVLGPTLAASGGILGFALRCPVARRLEPNEIMPHKAAKAIVIRDAQERLERERDAAEASRAWSVRHEAMAGRRKLASEARVAAFRAHAPDLDLILASLVQLKNIATKAHALSFPESPSVRIFMYNPKELSAFPGVCALSSAFHQVKRPLLKIAKQDVPALVAAARSEVPRLVVLLDELEAVVVKLTEQPADEPLGR